MTVAPATDSAESLRHRLVDQLTERGYLHDPQWQNAFRTVPREAFLGHYMVLSPDGAHRTYDLTDTAQHEAALVAVYSDNPLITQQDKHGTATSSSTAPSLMALMLEALQAVPGMTVMEIGTGTGYNSALLSHVLGDSAVTTIDIDSALVTSARNALHQAGYHPTALVVDGVGGHPERAPYDRLIATCGVQRVPAAWLGQVRAGGLLLLNLGFGLLRLTVDGSGAASGPFLDYASFMPIRSDTADTAATARGVLALAQPDGTRHTAQFPDVLDERPLVFLRSVMMAGVQQVIEHRPQGPEYVLAHPASGSWARAQADGTGTGSVIEGGPRHLWDELLAVADTWLGHGRPEISSYGLTVTSDGQHELWNNSTSQPQRWLLPE